MKYAQFFTTSVLDPNKLIEGCGTDSVYPLDGRKTLANQIEDVKRHLVRLSNVRTWETHWEIRSAAGYNRPFQTIYVNK